MKSELSSVVLWRFDSLVYPRSVVHKLNMSSSFGKLAIITFILLYFRSSLFHNRIHVLYDLHSLLLSWYAAATFTRIHLTPSLEVSFGLLIRRFQYLYGWTRVLGFRVIYVLAKKFLQKVEQLRLPRKMLSLLLMQCLNLTICFGFSMSLKCMMVVVDDVSPSRGTFYLRFFKLGQTVLERRLHSTCTLYAVLRS